MHNALVTGSTRNIGHAVAARLAREGIGVVINGRDQAAAERVAEKLRAEGARAVGIAADVTDPDAVGALVDRAGEELGPIDILVNNAVNRFHAPILDTSIDDWRTTLAIILDAAFLCTKAVLPAMREAGWGRIVNMAGVSGQKGGIDRAAVVTGKSGIIGFTKAVAMETAGDGVTVNTLSPGLIDTERDIPPEQEASARAHYEREIAQVPVGRYGTTDEVAAAVAFLCSDGAAFITGQTLSVNGGLYV